MGFILDGLETEAYDRNYSDRELFRRLLSYFAPHRSKIILVAAAISLRELRKSAGVSDDLLSSFGADILATTGVGDIDVRLALGGAANSKVLSQEIDKWIATRGLGNRPVAGAMVNFIVPLQVHRADSSKDTPTLEALRTAFGKDGDDRLFQTIRRACIEQAVAGQDGLRLLLDPERTGDYFLPPVRALVDPDRRWLDEALEGTGSAHLDDFVVPIAVEAPGASISVRIAGRDQPIEVSIERMRMHFALEGAIVVEWLAQLPDAPKSADGTPYWRQLIERLDSGRSAAAWTDFVSRARMLSSTFIASTDEAEKPFVIKLELNGKTTTTGFHLEQHTRKDRQVPITGGLDSILRHCLAPGLCAVAKIIAGCGGKLNVDEFDLAEFLEIRSDNRARVVTGLAFTGPQPSPGPATDQLMPLLERLRTVEPYAVAFPDDSALTSDTIEATRYGRYASTGTHFAASDHAFVTGGHCGSAYLSTAT